jgi:hypothetical protein
VVALPVTVLFRETVYHATVSRKYRADRRRGTYR